MALQNMTWESVVQAIATLYNTDAVEVERILSQYMEVGDVESAFKMLEGTSYEIWYNNDGTVRGYSYSGVPEVYARSKTTSDLTHLINSNANTSTKVATKAPLNTTVDQQTGKVNFEMGAKAAVGGATVTGLTKLKKYLPAAVLLASTTTQMGLMLNPDYWTKHTTDPILSNLKDIEPETYKQITMRDKEISETYPGKELFDGMIKTFTDPQTGESKGELYVEEMAMAYMVESMMQAGAFSYEEYDEEDEQVPDIGNYDLTEYFKYPIRTSASVEWINGDYSIKSVGLGDTRMVLVQDAKEPTLTRKYCIGGSLPLQVHNIWTNTTTGETSSEIETVTARKNVTYDGKTVYYGNPLGTIVYPDELVGGSYYINEVLRNIPWDVFLLFAWNLLYGSHVVKTGGIEGIGVQDGATVPPFTSGMSLSDIINLLDQTFPDMANKKIVQQVVQPDGSIKEYTYVPTPMPNPNPNPTEGTDPWDKPITGDSTQNDTEITEETEPSPDNPTNPIIQYVIQQITSEPEPTQENTGSGSTPPIVLPTGSAKALFRIWNPTQGEIDSLGAWLWSSQFIDQLLKMFSNPMEAIISLHKVFVSPTIGGRDDITIGYLNSGVNSNFVSGQYVTVNCGSVSLSEFYQNVFDYPPFTEVNLYLPFVGIVKLDTSDVMRGSVSVIYHVDVVTGACLAEVNVTRDSSGGIIYTYTGNCAVQYPLSSGSYMGVVTSAVGLAAGAVATYATGGATLPFLLRHGTSALSSAKTNVQRSGSFSANAGAMGCKKPYFIISRPQSNLANNFNMFVGKPANFTTKIGACTGFISCTDVHIENCNGTDSELAELENLLKSGIII
jgi:hypothetical protein